MSTTKFQLAAIACREYSLDNGWELADQEEKESIQYDTKEEALSFRNEFVKSLKISDRDVYYINLNTWTFEIDEETNEIDESEKPELESETLEIIDNSEKCFKFCLSEYHGQYMIPQGKFKMDYANENLTKNEYLLVIEYSSFQYHPKQLFKTEEEAKNYLIENDMTKINSPFIFEEEED